MSIDLASDAGGPDTQPQDVAAAPARAPAGGPATAGSLIRAAREAQGLDLASLAAMLKIPLRKLEALETGRHDELPGPTFERALAQAACRVLHIDAKPVLALLPQQGDNTLERVSGGLNTPFRERAGSRLEFGGSDGLLRRPAVILAGLLVLAAVAVTFVPSAWVSRAVQPVMASLSSATPPAAPGEAASAPAPLPVAPAVALSGTPVSAEATAAPAPVAASAAAPAAPAVDEVLAHAAPPPGIPVQLVADADSWCEVLDADGRTLLSRTVLAGETVGLDGALPMKVKIGNARDTHLALRGENVDLTPYTRDNVARVELK